MLDSDLNMYKCAFCDPKVRKNQSYFKTDTEIVLCSHSPQTNGHSLVITKKHVQDIRELDYNETANLWKTVKFVADGLEKIYGAEGFNFLFNKDPCAGQEVPHLHVHVIPRKNGDSLKKEEILPSDELNKYVRYLKNRFEEFNYQRKKTALASIDYDMC